LAEKKEFLPAARWEDSRDLHLAVEKEFLRA
jgi:hypothetical protein